MRWMATVVMAMLAVLPLGAQTPSATATVQKPSAAAQSPAPTQTGATAQQAQQAPKPLQVKVREVRLPVTVRGPHGHLVWDLGPEDFQVYDDGVRQHIEHFTPGSSALSVVLVVESSSRIASLMKGVRNSGIVFTQSVMGANGGVKPQDMPRGAVISFDSTPKTLVPFTTDRDKISNAVAKLKMGDSGIDLYDALSQALQMLSTQPQSRRRVIVAVSESTDSGSMHKLGNILRNAQLENVAIYSVKLSTTAAQLRNPATGQAGQPSIGPPGTFSGPGVPGVPQTPSSVAETAGNIDLKPLVKTLVKMGVNLISPRALAATSLATGGDNISTYHASAIQNAMDRIGSELHAVYTLAYQAPTNGPYGYHDITVKVNLPGYKVRTRPGYFLQPPNGSTNASP